MSSCEDSTLKQSNKVIDLPKIHSLKISENGLFIAIVGVILAALIGYFTTIENRIDKVEATMSSIQTDTINIKDSTTRIEIKIDNLNTYLLEQKK